MVSLTLHWFQSRSSQTALGIRWVQLSLPAKIPHQIPLVGGFYTSRISLKYSRALEDAKAILRTEYLFALPRFVMTGPRPSSRSFADRPLSRCALDPSPSCSLRASQTSYPQGERNQHLKHFLINCSPGGRGCAGCPCVISYTVS